MGLFPFNPPLRGDFDHGKLKPRDSSKLSEEPSEFGAPIQDSRDSDLGSARKKAGDQMRIWRLQIGEAPNLLALFLPFLCFFFEFPAAGPSANGTKRKSPFWGPPIFTRTHGLTLTLLTTRGQGVPGRRVLSTHSVFCHGLGSNISFGPV